MHFIFSCHYELLQDYEHNIILKAYHWQRIIISLNFLLVSISNKNLYIYINLLLPIYLKNSLHRCNTPLKVQFLDHFQYNHTIQQHFRVLIKIKSYIPVLHINITRHLLTYLSLYFSLLQSIGEF